MKSTKKVVPKKGAILNKSATKKVATKKTTPKVEKILTAKEVTKTVARKSRKKLDEKSVAEIKSVTKTVVPKKGAVDKTLETKLSVLTELHTKNKTTNKTPVKSYLPTAIEPESKTLYGKFVSYKSSITVNELPTFSIKAIGSVLTIAGIISSLFFSTHLFTKGGQLAQITATTSTSSSENVVTVDCKDLAQYSNQLCRDKVNKTPEANFGVEGTKNNLQGTTPVRVNVLHASKVTLTALDRSINQTISLGSMNRVSDDSWEFKLDTTNLHDGEYRLKASIVNVYGNVYEAQDQSGILITNLKSASNVVVPSVSSSTQSLSVDSSITTPVTLMNTETTSTTAQIKVIPSTLTALPKEATTTFSFLVKSDLAKSVSLKAINTLTKKDYIIGEAIKNEEKIWKINWDVSTLPAGEYYVTAQISLDNASGTLEKISTVVKKPNTTVLVKPLATTTKQLQPEIKIDVYGSRPLTKVIGMKIDVENATSVEIYAKRISEQTEKYLGKAKRITDTTWQLYTDTTLIPNGSYVFTVWVQNEFGRYNKQSENLQVLNAVATTTVEQKEKIQVILETEKSINPAVKIVTASTSNSTTTGTTTITTTATKATETVTTPESLSVEQKSEATKKIIEERTGEKVSFDSDKDGVTNYDEATIYKTNPYSADSDSDGFNDGDEILNGHDPLNEKSEALVAFESPKEAGVVRADILAVTSISTALPEDSTDGSLATSTPQAIISGKALPNSFVTLYIFSTPVVVTLKTDEDGTWIYRFDKEIEDGKHQIYVGITDNAGKIVAKSEPFSFIKVAEAYTPDPQNVNVEPAPLPSTDNSLLSRYMIFLVFSISITAIGLLLIILGSLLNKRRQQNKMMAASSGVSL